MTPMAYLTRCRIERSCHLLRRHPEMNITDIAFTSGFASSQYFSTVFNAHLGVTPREYRKGVRSRYAVNASTEPADPIPASP